MPANRLRNENWRQCLQKIHHRGGALEISLARPGHADATDTGASTPSAEDLDRHDASTLIWRVKMLNLTDDEIVVESPMTLGTAIPLAEGAQVIGVMTVGQNRWMFGSHVLGHLNYQASSHRELTALRLCMPKSVERCRRRNFYRVSTMTLTPPKVSCWALLDPASAIIAENANQAQILSAQEAAAAPKQHADADETPNPYAEHFALPEVGPRFNATLANIGGGGIGLLVEPDDARSLPHHRLYWLRIALPPEVPHPLAVTSRLVHMHIDSAQRTYAGMAFEFGHNRRHQDFIVSQLCRYVDMQMHRGGAQAKQTG
ncbi:MAG: hypothetical protein D8M59_14340 [Planctomycetes bacterium]|nr:hypothetical protein [Planctomycetota bacterium]NOG55510.1 hypothetical protein [Planctomycetota bacterium]